MTKKYFSYPLLFGLCMFTIDVSCKKDLNNSLKISQIDVKAPVDSNFVSLGFASVAAKQVNTSRLVIDIVKKRNTNSVNLPLTKEVQDSMAVPNAINPSYYIFNYKEEGML